jgi:hypothetical protein
MNVKSSIRILFQLATKIKWISDTSLTSFMNRPYLSQIKYYDDFFNSLSFPTSISGICQDFQIIYCCSFIDEYDKWFTPAKYPEEKDRILKVKRIVLPAYNRIKSWKDLKTLRNQIIAHNHRINGKSIFDHESKVKYNVPTTNEEYVLLADLVFLIAHYISPVFPEIVKEIDFNISLRDHLSLQSEQIDSYSEYKRIEKEVENRRNCP